MPKIFAQREMNENRKRKPKRYFRFSAAPLYLFVNLRSFLTTEDTESTEEKKEGTKTS